MHALYGLYCVEIIDDNDAFDHDHHVKKDDDGGSGGSMNLKY